MVTLPRIVAVDWSGDRRHAARRIWLAESRSRGQLVRLENGREHENIGRLLIEEGKAILGTKTVVDVSISWLPVRARMPSMRLCLHR